MHRFRVTDDETLEAPRLSQHLGEQPAVAGGRDAVEVHVGGHDVAGTGLDRRPERREIDVPEFGIGEIDLVVVTTSERRAVAGEMLGAGDHPLRCADGAPLEATDLGGGNGGSEERILAGAFDHPSPAWVAGDVDHRREGPVDPDGSSLPRRNRLTPLDGRRIPRRSHRDRDREDRPEAVDHVEPEQRGNAEPAALDREPLQPVRLGRVGDEEQGAGLATSESRLDHRALTGERDPTDRLRVGAGQCAEVEVLGELSGLLGHRHAGDQLVDPRTDRRLACRCLIRTRHLIVGHLASPSPAALPAVANAATTVNVSPPGRRWFSTHPVACDTSC